MNGKQYVVIAAGGGKLGTPSGDSYVAFALPSEAGSASAAAVEGSDRLSDQGVRLLELDRADLLAGLTPRARPLNESDPLRHRLHLEPALERLLHRASVGDLVQPLALLVGERALELDAARDARQPDLVRLALLAVLLVRALGAQVDAHACSGQRFRSAYMRSVIAMHAPSAPSSSSYGVGPSAGAAERRPARRR